MNQPYLIPPNSNEQPVKEESTFQRDMHLLLRHRSWGFDVPATDIDFLEYDNAKAIALVEYKRTQDLNACTPRDGANLEALADLGDRAELPVFVTFYNQTLAWYRIFPVNAHAVNTGPPEGILPEIKYIDFLYWLRGREIPDEVAERFG